MQTRKVLPFQNLLKFLNAGMVMDYGKSLQLHTTSLKMYGPQWIYVWAVFCSKLQTDIINTRTCWVLFC